MKDDLKSLPVAVQEAVEQFDVVTMHGEKWKVIRAHLISSAPAVQPVAEVVSAHGDPEAFGERRLELLADLSKIPYGTKLYTHPQPAAEAIVCSKHDGLGYFWVADWNADIGPNGCYVTRDPMVFAGAARVKDVALGEKLFEFLTFDDWVNGAQSRFAAHRFKHGLSPSEVVAVDAKGRICAMGKQFMRARDDAAFPVSVYNINPVENMSDLA